jgi:ParB-like nuclease domain
VGVAAERGPDRRRVMGWRDKYTVHPAADVWPMMPEAELQELAADIKANGLRVPIVYYFTSSNEKMLIDGRNRLEAMERAGVELQTWDASCIGCGDDVEIVSKVIGLNAHRRHLNKEAKGALIVAAHQAAAKLNQASAGPVSERPELKEYRGGRGKKNPIKEAAVATGHEHGISERTIKRALAKSAGKTPKPSKQPKPKRAGAEVIKEYMAEVGPYPTCGYEVNKDPDPDLAACRRRGILHMCHHAAEATKHHHFEDIPPEEIDMAIVEACAAASTAWRDLSIRLSEAIVNDALDAPKKKACRTCHGTGTITSKKTGTTVDCDCVRRGTA